jgi:hypothetical protein
MQRRWKYTVYTGIGLVIVFWLYSLRGAHTTGVSSSAEVDSGDSENALVMNTRYSAEDINSMDRSTLLSFRHSVLPENRLLAVYAEATPTESRNSKGTASADWGSPEAIEAFRKGLEDTGVISRDAPISLFGPFRGKRVRAAILHNLAHGHRDMDAGSLKLLVPSLVAIVRESDDPGEVSNAACLLGRMGSLAPSSARVAIGELLDSLLENGPQYWKWVCIRENMEPGSTKDILIKGLVDPDTRDDVLGAITAAVRLGYEKGLLTKKMSQCLMDVFRKCDQEVLKQPGDSEYDVAYAVYTTRADILEILQACDSEDTKAKAFLLKHASGVKEPVGDLDARMPRRR